MASFIFLMQKEIVGNTRSLLRPRRARRKHRRPFEQARRDREPSCFRLMRGIPMEKAHWLGRKRASLANARAAATAEARLIHYDLAGRYSIKAALAAPAP